MRAVQVVEFGSPIDVVEVNDIEVPEVGPGEIRVAGSAASLNYGDIARARGGVATMQAEPPFTLGMDVCGVVEAAGAGAEDWLGRRVVAMAKSSFGGMAEQVICTANGVFDAPAELDDVEAAGFLLPFHTSYLGLHTRARVQPGETVMVVGAASSVGAAAVQVAVAAGARVIALAGGEEKGKYCTGLGASLAIDYREEDVYEKVMEFTDGQGADVVFDLVSGDQTGMIWTCVAREGRYLPVGFNDDKEGGLSGKPLRMVSVGNFSVLGVMLSYSDPIPAMRTFGMNPFPIDQGPVVHSALSDLITSGAIRPAVERRIGMKDVGAALDDHEQRRTRGRTVVDIAGSVA